MKLVGLVLIVLGIMLLATAVRIAPEAPDVSYLMGTFLPGLVCLIVGLKLRQTKKAKPDSRADTGESSL